MFYTVTAIDLFNFYFEVLDIFLINLLTPFFMLILNKDFSFKLLIFFLIPTLTNKFPNVEKQIIKRGCKSNWCIYC